MPPAWVPAEDPDHLGRLELSALRPHELHHHGQIAEGVFGRSPLLSLYIE